MNELEYDAMQKKRIGRGARHRKGGSKSKRCSLPSDGLTPAQMAAMSGPVESWSMNVPMGWDAFVSAPLDIQQSYIDAVQGRFGVTISRISTDLFGLSVPALHKYMKNAGLKCSADAKGRWMTVEERDAWKEWLCTDPRGGGESDSDEEEDDGQ